MKKKFKITYRDRAPGAPTFTWRTRAHSAEHAREKFLDDGDDWEIVKIERIDEDDALPRDPVDDFHATELQWIPVVKS